MACERFRAYRPLLGASGHVRDLGPATCAEDKGSTKCGVIIDSSQSKVTEMPVTTCSGAPLQLQASMLTANGGAWAQVNENHKGHHFQAVSAHESVTDAASNSVGMEACTRCTGSMTGR